MRERDAVGGSDCKQRPGYPATIMHVLYITLHIRDPHARETRESTYVEHETAVTYCAKLTQRF